MADEQNMTGVEREHMLAALSYLAFLVLIPLFFVDKREAFVKFHAKQGLVILLGFIVAGIATVGLPIFGNLLMLLLSIASIAGLIQSLQGKWWKVPIIGDLAAKFGI